MRRLFVWAIVMVPFFGQCQGIFLGNNPGAPTRIGSLVGPFAGPDIFAQFLAGTNSSSLSPVANPIRHAQTGYVSDGDIGVPGIPPGTFGYVQMVAWDGLRWGGSLNGVPPEQLGQTDIVRQYFSYDFQPTFAPVFTQPAVVPIPEPSTLALGVLGTCALWLALRQNRKSP